MTLTVTGDDQRSETQPLAAFHHLSDAVDVNELVIKIQFPGINTT
jgi:hypothetical protein